MAQIRTFENANRIIVSRWWSRRGDAVVVEQGHVEVDAVAPDGGRLQRDGGDEPQRAGAIGEGAGYASPAQFSRDYKRAFGASPSRTRRQVDQG